MKTLFQIESKLKQLEDKQPEKTVKFCWINPGDDEDAKVAEMQQQYPDSKIISTGWAESGHP